MYIAGRWADRRLSKLELACATIVLGIIVFFLLQHMLKLFARAESTMLATSIMNMSTTLQYRAAWYRLKNNHAALEAMQSMNVFKLEALETEGQLVATEMKLPAQMLGGLVNISLPPNYAGELDGVDPSTIKGGNWYFDPDSRRIVYRVRNDEFFYSELPGPARVEFKVEIDYEDRNKNNQFDPTMDEFRNIGLRSIGRYEWQL